MVDLQKWVSDKILEKSAEVYCLIVGFSNGFCFSDVDNLMILIEAFYFKIFGKAEFFLCFALPLRGLLYFLLEFVVDI